MRKKGLVSSLRLKSLFLFVGLAISGILMFSGIASLNYPSFAEVKQLSGPLYQENVRSHPIDPDSLQGKIIKVVEKVSPAVVSISTERTVKARSFEFPGWDESPFDEFFKHFFEEYPQREYKQRGLGSGMIINRDGYILTNEHVIHGADRDRIKVTLPDGRTFKAEIVGTDEESDIAVLKIKGGDLPVVTLGDSDNLRVGQWAIAIGNPFGFALSQLSKKYEPTVTVGVISATGRIMQAGGAERRTYTDLIQTDAAINPGNSGGPLVNIWGEVIGINTAILTPSGGSIGIGFAIPINKAKRVLESLIRYGEVRWPWVGIVMQELTPELSEKLGIEGGVQIVGVEEGGPADRAGVQPGDILVKVNGKRVTSMFEAREEILKAKVGETVTLTVMRNGKELDIPVTTVERKKERETMRLMEQNYARSELLGIEVHNITSELRKKYRLPEGEEGVVITDIEEGSPVSMVGLEEGDVIKEINGRQIKNVDDFRKAMSKVSPGDMVYIGVRCGRWNLRVYVYTRK